jgi:hypothetical protein
MARDAHTADIHGYWRNPTSGSYYRYSVPIDASERIVLAVNRLYDPISEGEYAYAYDQHFDNAAGSPAPESDLPLTTALLDKFQFCGLPADASAAGDLDVAFVAWLHTPLSADEVRAVLGMCQDRWGYDVVPLITTVLTPIAAAGQIIMVDLTSTNQTVALPAGHRRGDRLEVQVTSAASGHTCTLDPSGAQTINGASTLVLSTDYAGALLTSDGTNWLARKW